jgi:transposase
MGRYSIDFRRKVVTAYKLGFGSIRQLAEQFMLSPSTVHSYIKKERETQDLNPKKPGPKRPGKLEAHREFIVRMVQEHPDWTVRQYREYLLTEQDVYVSVGGMCEFLKKEKLTLKKKTYRAEKVATESGQKQRLDYRERVRDLPEEKMIFIDETAFWVGMSRSVARSKKGKKAFCLRPFYKGRKMTLIGAISIEGVVAKKTIEGSMKGKDFKSFVEQNLVPKLKPGNVVVMDNLKIHKMEGIEELITATGARVEYLPPYSPDFNPIEMLWSTVKSLVRMFPSRSKSVLEKLIEVALMVLGKDSFKNWFTKCCYCNY